MYLSVALAAGLSSILRILGAWCQDALTIRLGFDSKISHIRAHLAKILDRLYRSALNIALIILDQRVFWVTQG